MVSISARNGRWVGLAMSYFATFSAVLLMRLVQVELAQAAAKRGLNPTTSSRHMKALGHKFRQSLSKLAEELDEYFAADREAKQIERKLIWRDVHRAPGLGGVQVSTPASDKFDREIEHVQSLLT